MKWTLLIMWLLLLEISRFSLLFWPKWMTLACWLSSHLFLFSKEKRAVKHAYTNIYTCIYMHTHIHTRTHASINKSACSYTYMHTHIHTHTHNIYICTHASAPGTTALQRLREKPDLTPRKLRTSPLEVVVPSPFNEICSTRNDGSSPNTGNHTTQQLITPSRQRADQTTIVEPQICTGVEPIKPVHGPTKLRAAESMLRNRFHIFAIFPPLSSECTFIQNQ